MDLFSFIFYLMPSESDNYHSVNNCAFPGRQRLIKKWLAYECLTVCVLVERCSHVLPAETQKALELEDSADWGKQEKIREVGARRDETRLSFIIFSRNCKRSWDTIPCNENTLPYLGT